MVLLVATLCKSGKAERLTKAEGLPKNISIEEFLDEPGEQVRADYPTFDKWYRKTHKETDINKKISISIKFPDGIKIAKTGISFTELKHLIERLEVVC